MMNLPTQAHTLIETPPPLSFLQLKFVNEDKTIVHCDLKY